MMILGAGYRRLHPGLVLSLLLVLVTVPLGGWAQSGRGGGPTGGRVFDPATVQTVNGQITQVSRPSATGGGTGVHFQLKTGTETLEVHVGPAFFVDGQPLKLTAGDRVKVTGSRVTVSGKATIIASRITRGAMTLELRDATGRPVWAGQGRRGGAQSK